MLFGSAILEVTLGVAFIYLLLSLLCSTLNEWIAGVLQLRAKTLRQGIENLLDDPYAPGLLERFLDHPLIKGLSRKGKESFPSYIPARTFALALIDTIAPTDYHDGPRDLKVVYAQFRDELAQLSKANSPLAKSLLTLVDEAGGNPQKIEQAATALQKLAESRNQLLDAIGRAEGDLQNMGILSAALEKLQAVEGLLKQAETEATATLHKMETNLETYFNDAMDRVSGWYKRRAQIIIIVIALITTLLLNADTLAIANKLGGDAALRASIVSAAERYLQEQPEAATATDSTTTTTVGASLTPPTTITETLTLIDQLDLPIGWTGMPRRPSEWFYKVVGLLVTVIAVSLGAPFWFGILNKVINLRMTGTKPDANGAAG